jgi:hypothetical protein
MPDSHALWTMPVRTTTVLSALIGRAFVRARARP